MSKKGATPAIEPTPELDPSLVSGDAWVSDTINKPISDVKVQPNPNLKPDEVRQLLDGVAQQLGLTDKGLEWFSSDGFYILAKPVIKVPFKNG